MKIVREYSAPSQKQKRNDPFTVAEVEGSFLREIVSYDPKSQTLVKREEEKDRCYMVTFHRGHSVVFYSVAELDAAGFGEEPTLPETEMVNSYAGD